MENEERQRAPFDRQAALEELERFGRDIERYRAERQAVGERFDTFIRSFETPPGGAANPPAKPSPTPTRAAPGVPPGAASTLTATSPPATPPPTPVPGSERAAADPRGDSGAIAAPAPVAAPALMDSTSAFDVARGSATDPHDGAMDQHAAVPFETLRAPAARGRSTFSTPALLGGTVIVVLAVGMLVRTLWNRAPESAPPAATTPATPVAAPEPTPASAPAPAATAQPTSASELTTIRRVWMRVTVDGARVLEREAPAGTRVPLNAEKTIVIRTGDAGAVRLSIRGQDRGFLGVEGEVVTRSFTVPPRSQPSGR